jgi:hypothetical protein
MGKLVEHSYNSYIKEHLLNIRDKLILFKDYLYINNIFNSYLRQYHIVSITIDYIELLLKEHCLEQNKNISLIYKQIQLIYNDCGYECKLLVYDILKLCKYLISNDDYINHIFDNVKVLILLNTVELRNLHYGYDY